MFDFFFFSNYIFFKAYRFCCVKTKGINFSYFLLLPMNRITRYPLIFEKLVKHTDPSEPKRRVFFRIFLYFFLLLFSEIHKMHLCWFLKGKFSI